MGNTARRIRQSLLLSSALIGLSTAAWAQSPIDTNAPYYLASQLGTTVDPTFFGGTLKIDEINHTYPQDFYVARIAGNTVDKNGNTATFAGHISGSGRLATSGAGTLIIAGDVDVPLDVASGTLQIGSGDTHGWINNAITLTNGAVVVFDRLDNVTHLGIISGHGELHQDSGTLILAGQYSYDGDTVIAPGSTLQIGNGVAGLPPPGMPSSGDFVDNGTLIFKLDTSHTDMVCNLGCSQTTYIDRPPTAITISANVSGVGSLAQWGAAPIILTGTNTYSGGTAIDLRVPPAYFDVPAQPAVLQIGNGGTAGSIIGDVEVDYGKLVFNRSDTYAFAGAISGSGQVEQRGPGTLILTGNSSYTGGTTISAGTLQIGNVGTTGSIVGDVVDSGTLAFNRSDMIPFPGVISGTSGQVRILKGTAVLSGNNTITGGSYYNYDTGDILTTHGWVNGRCDLYSVPCSKNIVHHEGVEGGLIIYPGATAQIGDGGVSGTWMSNIFDYGTLVFDRSDMYTYSGTILAPDLQTLGFNASPGSLRITGGGTLVLTGNNDPLARVIVDAGSTLQLGDGPSSAMIDNFSSYLVNGTLAINGALINGIYQKLEGSGVIHIMEPTELVGDQPDFTGRVVVDPNVLLEMVASDQASFAPSIVLQGTLTTRGQQTISGDISGAGSVESRFATLVLTGDNTYTGGTTIDSGTTLQLGNGGATGSIVGDVANNGKLVFDRSNTVTLSGAITGTGSVEQKGTGTTILTAYNAYSGGTTISAGTLQIGNGGTSGSITDQYMTLNREIVDNGTLAFNRSDTYVFYGTITGGGSLHQMGPGTLSIGSDAPNTYTGGTLIDAGSTLEIGGAGDELGVGAVTDNGTLAIRNSVKPFVPDISGTGVLHIVGSVTLTGASTQTGGTTIDSEKLLQIGDGGTAGTIAGDIANAGILSFNRSDTTLYAGSVSGNGALRQIGSGKLILTGNSTFTGGTAETQLWGYVQGPLTLTWGAHGDPYWYYPRTLLRCENNPNCVDTWTVVQITGGTEISPNSTLQIGNGGTTGSLASNIFNAGTLIFDRSDSYTFAAVISDNPKAPAAHGAVQQIGTGTLILNGHNTYTGLTTVSAGTLMVGDAAHPDATIAGDVVVSNGATLSGHGAIGGTVTNNGGTISPGGSIGTLTVQNLTQSPTSTLHVDVTPAGSSQLIVTGTASLAGTLEMDFTPGDYSAVRSANFLSAGSITGAFTSFVRGGAAGTAVFGLVPTPTGFNVIVQSERGGQIYSDVASAAIDRTHGLNRHFNDHDVPCNASCPAITVWAEAFGDVSSSDDRTYQANDYWSRSAGVIGGADYRLENGITLGVGFAHSAQIVGVTQNWGKSLGHSMAVALNGSLPVWDGRLALDLVYASNSDTVRRDLGTLGSVAARRGGHSAGVEAQIAYPLPFEDFSVTGQLSYAHLSFAGSTESGVTAANLTVTPHSYDSLRGEIGARFRHVYDLGSGLTLAPQAGLGLLRELNSLDRGVDLSVEGVMNSTFIPPYARPDRIALTGQAGAEIGDDSGFALLLKASGFVSGHQRAAELSLGGRLRF